MNVNNLTYYLRGNSFKKYVGRRLDGWKFILVCPDTGLEMEMTRKELDKKFRGDKKNKGQAWRKCKVKMYSRNEVKMLA